MASPSYHDATNGNGGTTTQVVDKPANVVTNDILILQVYWEKDTAVTITPPTNFVEISNCSADNTGSSPDCHQRVYWKRATGSEPATYTVTFSSTVSGSANVTLSAFSGAWTGGTPIEDADKVTANGNLTLPSVTAGTIDTLIIGLTASFNWANTWSSSALTERWDNQSMAIYSSAQASAGESGTKLITQSAVEQALGAILVLASTGTALLSSLVPPDTINQRNKHLFVR